MYYLRMLLFKKLYSLRMKEWFFLEIVFFRIKKEKKCANIFKNVTSKKIIFLWNETIKKLLNLKKLYSYRMQQ